MEFADQLLSWFDRCGRKNFPWQQNCDPYRIWVSEIMLQQTRTTTAVAYFERFVDRFATVDELAGADIDSVLHLWSGLGYYSRANHLHRAAQIIRDRYGGELPRAIDTLQSLPGIGRSTAGAILAQAYGDRHPILDGNAKRVICRYHAVDGWPGKAAVQRRLWALAKAHTPHQRVADYTQAIMDLGATVCTRSRPLCEQCPIARDCIAFLNNRQRSLPTPRPLKPLPSREIYCVIVRADNGNILLEKRPPVGVWGGLYSFPECATIHQIDPLLQQRFGLTVTTMRLLAPIKHTFSHYKLMIHPAVVETKIADTWQVMESAPTVWYNNTTQPIDQPIGIAAPVQRILQQLESL